MRRIGRQAVLTGQRVHALVPITEPGAAHVGRCAILEVPRPDATTDSVTRFKHCHRTAGALHSPRGGKSGAPCSNNADIGFDSVHSGHAPLCRNQSMGSTPHCVATRPAALWAKRANSR